jgi:hypothetical protein
MPDDIPDAHWRTLIGDTISEKFPKQACLEDVKDSYLLCIEVYKVLKVGAMTPSQANLDFAKGKHTCGPLGRLPFRDIFLVQRTDAWVLGHQGSRKTM